MELVTALVYIARHTPSIALSFANRKGLYRKELIPVGQFVKDNAKPKDHPDYERIPFDVEDSTIQHWYDTFKLMRDNGISVPMPLAHTENPEMRRGTVVDMEIGENEEGKKALFAIFKYRDKEAEKALKDADVSIYVPEKFVDGYGNEYLYPIKHVAFTDSPVIPKLGKIQPIAASLAGEGEEKMAMGNTGFLRKLATKLGLGKEIPDDKLEAALMHVVDAIMNEEDDDENEEEGEEEEGEEEAASNMEEEEGEEEEGHEEEEEGEEEIEEGEETEEEGHEEESEGMKKKKKKPAAHLAREAHVKEYHPPISAAFLGILGDARETKLDRLVEQNCITPAVRDKLKREFCSKSALSLAFSTDSDKAADSFDSVIAALEENSVEQLVQQETSGGQELSLAYSSLQEQGNALTKNAEARRKAANQ